MHALDAKIIAALTSPSPPLTHTDLCARCEANPGYVASRLSELLTSQAITLDQLPWRTGPLASKRGRPRGVKNKARGIYADIDKRLEQIAAEDGGDRVAALRALLELRTTSTEAVQPPVPDDHDALFQSLTRIITAAGPDLTREAVSAIYPEAPIAQTEATPNVEGPPPS